MTPQGHVKSREYCDVHEWLVEQMRARSFLSRFFTTRKLVAIILAFVSACATGVGYIVDKDMKAEAQRASISADLQANYVRHDFLSQLQKAQDAIISVHMQETTERLNRVQKTVEETSKLVQRIAGKLNIDSPL